MMAVSHLLLGGGSWLAYSKATGAPLYEGMAIAAISSLLPDIDYPASFVGKRLLFLSVPISAVFGHRGITHSLLAVIAAAFAVIHYGATGFMASAVAIGYLSHLVGDFFANSGVPLFWPYKRRFASPLVFNTGGFMEYLFQAGLVFLIGQAVLEALRS